MMCEKTGRKIQEVISMEEYLVKRKNVIRTETKITQQNEKEAAIVNAALELVYLYV